jgi:hypothetical protein
VEHATKELPCLLTGFDGARGGLVQARPHEAMTRIDGCENPSAEAPTLAKDVGLERAHPTGINLQFRTRRTVSDRHRGCAATEAEVSDGEAMQRRVGDGHTITQEFA